MSAKVNYTQELQYTPAAPASTAWTLQQANVPQTLYARGTVTRGGWITNPATAAGQGIGAAENVYVTLDDTEPTTTEGGSVFAILPGQTLALPPLATAVKWIAATVGHRVSTWKE